MKGKGNLVKRNIKKGKKKKSTRGVNQFSRSEEVVVWAESGIHRKFTGLDPDPAD